MCEVEGNIKKDDGEEFIIGRLRYKTERGAWCSADGSEVESFRHWAGVKDDLSDDDDSMWYNQRMVNCVTQEFENGKFLNLSVSQWYPFSCQGSRNYSSFSFSHGPVEQEQEQEIFWTRSPAEVINLLLKAERGLAGLAHKLKPMPLEVYKKKCLNDAFEAILPAGLRGRLQLSINDEIAYEVLYSKLLHHPTITKIDIPRVQYRKGALVNFCCNLIINSDTLEEVLFQDIGSMNEEMIQTLFESAKTSRNLKVLALRTSRYLETWNKARSGDSNKPVLRAEPILEALQSVECSECSLETLDFGGNKIVLSSSPISELMTALLSPSLGLKRLSFRACDLTEEGLLAVAMELVNNDCLEFLDLSHNTITKRVMEHLVKNKTLKELKLEHCKIDLETIECLTSSLPQMQRLQHLHMDGNEFTWEPLTETKEAIGAIAVLKALQQNKSLLSLNMGEFGRIASWGMSCCQSPPYHTTLGNDNMEQLDLYLERNKELLEEMKESRSQQAVVKIAEILLGKLADEAE